MRWQPLMRRAWIGLGMTLGLLGGISLAVTWLQRDPWPARVVLPYIHDHVVLRTPGFTADGRSFLIANYQGMVAWDVATGEPRQPQPDPLIESPVFAHDRRSFVGLVGWLRDQDVVWVDAASGAIRQRFATRPSQVRHLAWGDDDRSIQALVWEDHSRVAELTWDLASGARTRRLIRGGDGFRSPEATAPDGRLIAFTDPTNSHVLIWDVPADRLHRTLLRSSSVPLELNVDPVFSPDGRTLYVGRDDGQVECWDVAAAQWLRTLPLPSRNQDLVGLSLAPDGKILAVGGVDRRPTTWLGQTWDRLVEILPGSTDLPRGTLALIDSASGRPLIQTQGSHAAQFAPDGRSVATFEYAETISIRPMPPAAGP